MQLENGTPEAVVAKKAALPAWTNKATTLFKGQSEVLVQFKRPLSRELRSNFVLKSRSVGQDNGNDLLTPLSARETRTKDILDSHLNASMGVGGGVMRLRTRSREKVSHSLEIDKSMFKTTAKKHVGLPIVKGATQALGSPPARTNRYNVKMPAERLSHCPPPTPPRMPPGSARMSSSPHTTRDTKAAATGSDKGQVVTDSKVPKKDERKRPESEGHGMDTSKPSDEEPKMEDLVDQSRAGFRKLLAKDRQGPPEVKSFLRRKPIPAPTSPPSMSSPVRTARSVGNPAPGMMGSPVKLRSTFDSNDKNQQKEATSPRSRVLSVVVAEEPEIQGTVNRPYTQLSAPTRMSKIDPKTEFGKFIRGSCKSPNQKVFILASNLPTIKKCLEGKKWVCNPDKNSSAFDLKWTLKDTDVNYKALDKHQSANHFEGCQLEVSTKIGISRNLHAMECLAGVDVSGFFPMCFSLGDRIGIENFCDAYMAREAETRLMNFTKNKKVKRISAEAQKNANIDGNGNRDGGNENEGETNPDSTDKVNHSQEGKEEDTSAVMPRSDKIRIVHDANEENASDDDEDGIGDQDEDDEDEDHDDDDYEDDGDFDDATEVIDPDENIPMTQTYIDNILAYSSLLTQWSEIMKEHQDECKNRTKRKKGYRRLSTNPEQRALLLDKKKAIPKKDSKDAIASSADVGIAFNEAKRALNALATHDKQVHMRGDSVIWIVKPARSSRGRGIRCFNKIQDIISYAKKKKHDLVAQMYIQRPLLIHRKKFDIRQWILVSDLNPLTIWFYNECYLRFSAEEFDAKDLDNRYIHLCNRSIQKDGNNYEKDEHSNMWSLQQFQDYLKSEGKGNIWKDHICPRMKQIAALVFESVLGRVQERKGSFEVFGFDFMIDSQYNVWLIEVNTSPDMSKITPVMRRMVPEMLEGMLKIVLNPSTRQKQKVDKFEMIHYRKVDGKAKHEAFWAKEHLLGVLAKPSNSLLQHWPPELTGHSK